MNHFRLWSPQGFCQSRPMSQPVCKLETRFWSGAIPRLILVVAGLALFLTPPPAHTQSSAATSARSRSPAVERALGDAGTNRAEKSPGRGGITHGTA